MLIRLIYIFLFLYLQSLPILGQGFSFYEYFSPEELDLSHPQNWTAIQDTNGYIFIGNGGGYLTFNGKDWSANHIGENGRGNSFFLSSKGKLYANGTLDYGFFTNDNLYQIEYESISSNLYKDEEYVPYIWEAYEIDEKIYYRHNFGIIEYDPVNKSVIDYQLEKNRLWNSFIYDNRIIVDANDGLYAFKDSTFTKISVLNEYQEDRILFSLDLSNKKMLIGILNDPKRSNENSLYIFEDFSLNPFLTEVDSYLKTHIAFKAILLNDEMIAIATLSGGVVFLNKNGELIKILTEKNGLHVDEVYNLYKDHENQLWIMLSEGVQKIDLNKENLGFGEIYGFEGVVEELTVSKNNVWGINEAQIFVSYTMNPEKTLGFNKIELPSGFLLSGLFTINDQTFSYGTQGIYKLTESGLGEQIFNGYVSHHAYDRVEEKIVLIGENKIISFDGTHIDEHNIQLPDNVILTSVFKSELYLILSTSKNAFKIEGDEIIEIPIQKPEEGNIYYNEIGVIDNRLFIGAEGSGKNNGLFVLDENETVFKDNTEFGINSALSNKQVYKFQECSNGDVWFAANLKIMKATKSGSTWDVQSAAYNKISENSAYSYQCASNGVWVGGIRSLTFIDQDFDIDSTSFRTNITGVFVDRDSLIFGGFGEPKGAVELPFQDNTLRFDYAAASFIDTEKNTYSVKLEGFDNSWSRWNSETQKDYTNIPEGTYTFKVRSRNVYEYEGIPDQFTFTVLPPWYRTWWAYLLYVVLIISLLYSIYKIRINQILKVQRVRNRIADDLHDDLSGTLIGISNFARAIGKNPDQGKTDRFIGLIQQSADEAKEKISDIVWTINPEHDDWTNFLTKCRRHASDTFESLEIQYELDMDMSIPGTLTMEVRKNLWLVFKEIITNIAKHSNATFALISFKSNNGGLLISIKDNGVGFDKEEVESGNGLSNIKKRISMIKGTVQLESKPGNGTFWTIQIPL